jgi:hypothetical protein
MTVLTPQALAAGDFRLSLALAERIEAYWRKRGFADVLTTTPARPSRPSLR